MKKPDNFKQLRSVLNQTWMHMGREIDSIIKYESPRTTTRYLWKLADRTRRIRLQMKACQDIFEPSYCEAIVEMVFRKESRP